MKLWEQMEANMVKPSKDDKPQINNLDKYGGIKKQDRYLRAQQQQKPKTKEFDGKAWKDYLLSKGIKCIECPGVYANEITEFIGFRGYKDEITGINTLDIKGEEHKGEAWPPPIIPVTSINRDNLVRLTGKKPEELGQRFFLGVLKYELEILTLIFTLTNMGYENIALLMSRGHGKTYIFAWEEQHGLKYFRRNYMMLSETNARKKVGNWVYVWALRNGLLKEPEKYARKSTYQHFEMVNENRMDIYKYSDEDLVGEHDYILKLDDCVKRKWRERPTENEKMIDHFQSNINFIIRSGLHLAGTRKFEGDVIEHILKTVEDMIVIKLGPYIECPHGNGNDDGTFDACDICKDLALLAPEIHSHKSLKAKMYEDFEAWYAEMMQDPKPKKGGMVDEQDIVYCNRPFFTNVSHICIGVDSTESDMDSTDMCGIVSCAMLRPKNVEEPPQYVFLDADVRKMPFRTIIDERGNTHRGILETIAFMVKMYELHFPEVPIMIAVERQGGGIFIIKEAKANQKEHWWHRYLIGEKKTDKKPADLGLSELGIRHSKEKVARVYSELRFPIKKGQVQFSNNLWGSEFITQIIVFPRGKFDDGADAGGMAKDECAKRWNPKHVPRKIHEVAQEERKQKKYQEKFQELAQPWIKDQKRLQAKVNTHNRRRH